MPDNKGQKRQKLDKMIDFVTRINEWIGRIVSYLVVVMIATISYEVIARYFFNSPTLWVTELNLYILCGYILLSGGSTLAQNSHVRVDLFWSVLSERKKAIADVATSGFLFMFCIALIWKGGEMAYRAYVDGTTSSEAMGWPLLPSKLMVPLGGFLLLVQGLAKFLRDILTIWKGAN